MPLNRRSFLRRSGLIAAGVVAAPAVVRPAQEVTFKPGDRPRRIIHLVVDGMSLATLTCGDHLSHILRGRGLAWLALYDRPEAVTSLMDVRSLNSIVTDSSASSSAWGSGSRIVNGAVNMLPDGRKLRTLYELFGEAGWKRGLVTTTEITHATPAGFVASIPSRDSANGIAEQYFDRKVEVLLGGGAKHFDPTARSDKRDLRGEFAAAGYTVMGHRKDLAGAPLDRPWLGTFTRGHLPYTVDQANIESLRERVPTLPELTTAALRRLEREDRFILQIEGGRVDHASHMNDAAGTFRDMIVFDEAVELCLKFQEKHPDTLVVITADHATGGPSLNGAGGGYSLSVPLFNNLRKITRSHDSMLRRIRGRTDVDDEVTPDPRTPVLADEAGITDIIAASTEYRPSIRRVTQFRRFFSREETALHDLANNTTSQFAQLMGNYVGIGWTSLNHTSDYVPLAAVGPGAERFRGFVRNVDVFRHYTQLAGIDFKNPELPLMAESGPSAAEVERVADMA